MKDDLIAIGQALTRWPWGELIILDALILTWGLWKKKDRVAGGSLFILFCLIFWGIITSWISCC